MATILGIAKRLCDRVKRESLDSVSFIFDGIRDVTNLLEQLAGLDSYEMNFNGNNRIAFINLNVFGGSGSFLQALAYTGVRNTAKIKDVLNKLLKSIKSGKIDEQIKELFEATSGSIDGFIKGINKANSKLVARLDVFFIRDISMVNLTNVLTNAADATIRDINNNNSANDNAPQYDATHDWSKKKRRVNERSLVHAAYDSTDDDDDEEENYEPPTKKNATAYDEDSD